MEEEPLQQSVEQAIWRFLGYQMHGDSCEVVDPCPHLIGERKRSNAACRIAVITPFVYLGLLLIYRMIIMHMLMQNRTVELTTRTGLPLPTSASAHIRGTQPSCMSSTLQ